MEMPALALLFPGQYPEVYSLGLLMSLQLQSTLWELNSLFIISKIYFIIVIIIVIIFVPQIRNNTIRIMRFIWFEIDMLTLEQ